MNYRHAYHAGNPADCLKHAVLALLVRAFRDKDKPFYVLDTHAGIGLYDLAGEEAGRTGEWVDGIARLLKAPDPPAALAPYLEQVRALNPEGGLRWYPGSPLIARRHLRGGDRLVLCELHAEDRAALAARFAGDRQVKVHQLDGYLALKSFLPPVERRGLVLVDPPFERRDEFAALARGAGEAFRRFATGCYALWYPIKEPGEVARFHAGLPRLPAEKSLVAEVMFGRARSLPGTGLAILNPPYRLGEALATLLPFIAAQLGDADASWRLASLGEAA
ncbi:MAG: 23S rRNA (adenine(2030)-N(6))-methyltransferase RlmJ [Thalassobaculales bacterium]